MNKELEIIEKFLNYKNGEFKEASDKFHEALDKYNELKADVISLLGDDESKVFGEHLVKVNHVKTYNTDKIVNIIIGSTKLSDDFYNDKIILRIIEAKENQ